MYTCKIENEYGEQLELTNNRNYTVYKIDGLEPPTATINTSPVANFDGSRFNSSRTNERNIVIYLVIENDCEHNRINLYKYAKVKHKVVFYYKNSTRDVYIEGYVESMPIGFFDMKQHVQISILCPDPYFKSVNNKIVDFSTLKSLFVFPFAYTEAGGAFSELEIGKEQSIVNGGDVENGIIIRIQATGRVLNPVIYNFTKNEYFKINVDVFAGDEIILTTHKGKKGVSLIHEGVTTNIINSVVFGSKWFQLIAGDNLFGYDADEFPENLRCILTHCDEYEGV